MSYPISSTFLNNFLEQHKQSAKIIFHGVTSTMTLTDAHICQKGLVIDRYCISGDKLEIGSAISSEMSLTLNNYTGIFDNIIFEGAELFVSVSSGEAFIPMGYFTVDNSPRKLSTIKLTALDRMVNFDKYVDKTQLSFPITVGDLLQRICVLCNVSLSTSVATLLNYTYIIPMCPTDTNLTYRQLLKWIAEITCTCAYVDRDGKLQLGCYGVESIASINPCHRYSSDINENAITISGIKMIDADKNEYIAGNDAYQLTIESNSLIQNNYQIITDNIYTKIKDFSYTPFRCIAKPFVNLDPLDRIYYKDKDGNLIPTNVTNITFTLNGNISIMGQGETKISSEHAQLNPLTRHEQDILNTITDQQNKLTAYQQETINLNNSIANSLGLYVTIKKADDDSNLYYYHSNSVLEDSIEGDTIFTLKSEGFAICTTGWNNGEPIWQYGITIDGNSILNNLLVHNLTADKIISGKLQSVDGSSYFDLTNNKIVASKTAENITTKTEIVDGTLETAILFNGITSLKTTQSMVGQVVDLSPMCIKNGNPSIIDAIVESRPSGWESMTQAQKEAWESLMRSAALGFTLSIIARAGYTVRIDDNNYSTVFAQGFKVCAESGNVTNSSVVSPTRVSTTGEMLSPIFKQNNETIKGFIRELTSSDNLNDITDTGLYYLLDRNIDYEALNYPYYDIVGQLEVINYKDTVLQKFTPFENSCEYNRTGGKTDTGTEWLNWRGIKTYVKSTGYSQGWEYHIESDGNVEAWYPETQEELGQAIDAFSSISHLLNIPLPNISGLTVDYYNVVARDKAHPSHSCGAWLDTINWCIKYWVNRDDGTTAVAEESRSTTFVKTAFIRGHI